MKRILMLILVSAIAITVVAAAMAQSSDPASSKSDPQATDKAATDKATETAPPAATPPSDASTTAKDEAAPPAASATAKGQAAAATKTNPAIERVREHGVKVSAKEREDVDKKLDEIERQIENEATSKGDAAVAGRIAGEFSMTADALTAERSQYSRGWGEILIAHTLHANANANAKSDVTLADIYTMRNQGMSWAMIAHGLGLKLGGVVSAVKAEGRVALGLAKGDGKPAMIHAGTAASAKTGAKVGAGKTSTSAGTGVGVGVDLDKGTKIAK